MPEQFNYVATDPVVRAGLTAAEILAVPAQNWQNTQRDYQFEFHTQHEAGWPCYLREPDGPNRGLPKLNIKGTSWTGTLLQADSVISQDCSADFRRVVTANLANFRKLAQRYYEGVETANVIQKSWNAKFTCGNGPLKKTVMVRLPDRGQALGALFWSNMKKLANIKGKPKCPLHKDSKCLDDGVAVELSGQDSLAVKLIYDDAYAIVER